jgi:lysophospholipase L1-like esterase
MTSENTFESLENRTLLSAFEAHVNFQPSRAPLPAGYVMDAGLLFRQRGSLTYGWSGGNKNTVDRNSRLSPDQRYDTFNKLDFGRGKPVWEMAVPNGNYQVRIVAGDPLDKTAYYRIRAENTMVINGRANNRTRWKDATTVVNVSDGRLTISAVKGAIRNKINFIDIIGVTDPVALMQAESAEVSSGTSVNGSVVTSLDNGDFIQFKNVLFNSGLQSLYASLSVHPNDAGGLIEFRLGSVDGQLLGTMQTQATGRAGEFVTQHTDIEGVPSGIHDLYVVFKGTRAIGSIDWLHFHDRPLTWIMPVGDSITEGSGGHASYRHELWHKLENGGYATDFVGTRTGVRSGTGDPPAWDWDMNHEGHFGWRADQARDQISAAMESQMPDVVMLNIGINDLFVGQSTDSTASEIGQIIDRLRIHNPNVIVLLALLGPTDRVSNATILEMNAKIAELAAAKSTSTSQVRTVDLYTGFSHATHTYDGTHPNAAGEALQAERWFEALKLVLPGAEDPHHNH